MIPQATLQKILNYLQLGDFTNKQIAIRAHVSRQTVNRIRHGIIPGQGKSRAPEKHESIQKQVKRHREFWNRPLDSERPGNITSHHGPEYEQFLLRTRLSLGDST